MSFYTFEVLEKWSSAPLSTYFELLPPFAPCLPFVEDPLMVALSPRGGQLPLILMSLLLLPISDLNSRL